MKYVQALLITIIFVLTLSGDILAKKAGRYQSQGTRNYRKLHSDPSYNPLPNNYHTGPRMTASSAPLKYHAYNKQLSNHHSYTDATNIMRANHQDV